MLFTYFYYSTLMQILKMANDLHFKIQGLSRGIIIGKRGLVGGCFLHTQEPSEVSLHFTFHLLHITKSYMEKR